MGLIETIGIVLGSGTLGVVATKLVDARKIRLEHTRAVTAANVSEAVKVAQDLREMLQAERALVQNQVADLFMERKQHLDCLSRVASVETQFHILKQDHARCPERIQTLETTVEDLRDRVLKQYVEVNPPRVLPPKTP